MNYHASYPTLAFTPNAWYVVINMKHYNIRFITLCKIISHIIHFLLFLNIPCFSIHLFVVWDLCDFKCVNFICHLMWPNDWYRFVCLYMQFIFETESYHFFMCYDFFIHSAYTACMFQPIWIQDTQNRQKCTKFVQLHSERLSCAWL